MVNRLIEGGTRARGAAAWRGCLARAKAAAPCDLVHAHPKWTFCACFVYSSLRCSTSSRSKAPLAQVAELADALASGASDRKIVGVQVPPCAQGKNPRLLQVTGGSFCLTICGLRGGATATTAAEILIYRRDPVLNQDFVDKSGSRWGGAEGRSLLSSRSKCQPPKEGSLRSHQDHQDLRSHHCRDRRNLRDRVPLQNHRREYHREDDLPQSCLTDHRRYHQNYLA